MKPRAFNILDARGPSFVGTRAIDDDLAARVVIGEADRDGLLVSRDRSGSAVFGLAGGRAHVENHGRCTGVRHLRQFLDADARHAKFVVKASAIPPLRGDEDRERDEDQDDADFSQARERIARS